MKNYIIHFIVITFLPFITFFSQSISPSWAISFGEDVGFSNYMISTNATVIDQDGNIFTMGSFQNVMDIDPGSGITNFTSNGLSDIYIQKLNSLGEFQWAKSFGSFDFDLGEGMALDQLGNIYITGYYYSNTLDFDPGINETLLNCIGNTDGFVLKLDPNGDFLWVKQIGGLGSESGKQISVDLAGDVYVSGYFDSQIDFDPGLGIHTMTTSNSATNTYVLKLNPAGDFIWSSSLTGSSNFVYDMNTKPSNGNILLTGSFSGTLALGSENYTSNGSRDVFMLEMDQNSNIIWSKAIGSTTTDFGKNIVANSAGEVFVSGDYKNTIDLNPELGTLTANTQGLYDCFLLKLSPDGTFQWAKTFGGSQDEFNTSLCADDIGNVILGLSFNNAIDLDPGTLSNLHTSVGGLDIAILKLDELGNLHWAESFGGSYDDFSYQMLLTSNDEIVTSGVFGSSDFDVAPGIQNFPLTHFGSSFAQTVFVSKFNQVLLPGVEVQSIKKDLPIIYPNPVIGELHLPIETELNTEVILLDIQGNILNKSYLSANVLDVSELSCGMYFLRIIKNDIDNYFKFNK